MVCILNLYIIFMIVKEEILPAVSRLVMLMVGAKTIREVIAFPKTQSAACLMTNAPGEVSPDQLKDLNIRLRQKVKAETAAE